jgi:type II secretory pathway pseudopilin PulG
MASHIQRFPYTNSDSKADLKTQNTNAGLKTRTTVTGLKTRATRGFTLLEMILVIAMTLLIMSTLATTLYYSGRSSAQTRSKMLKKQELMKYFHQIRFQLINLYKTKEGPALLGEEGTREKNSALYMITPSMLNYRGVGEVGYKIQRDENGKPYFAYTEFPYPRNEITRFSFLNHETKWRRASNLIEEFQVEYGNANQWSKEWRTKELPEKVRIVFWYKESEQDEKLQPFTFIAVPGLRSVF